MTSPDPRFERSLERTTPPPENVQDVVSPAGRNQDPQRADLEHDLAADSVRPLTDEEKKLADRDVGGGERVYAPASERVPRTPVPGHRDFVDHTDPGTPERQAVAHVEAMDSEPSFTRVARPSVQNGSHPSQPSMTPMMPTMSMDRLRNRRGVFLGLGVSWFTVMCCSVGVWLFMRWQHERNKPISRLRRQATRAATELRNRAPDPREAARPTMGLTTALLTLGLLTWQQTQSRARKASKTASRKTKQAVTDADWQKRLMHLKGRWNPARLELEKIQISRH